MSITPLPGDRAKHVKTGRLYRVVCIAKVEATLELVVVYQSEQDGQHWTRPIEDFMDGRFTLYPASS